MLNIEMTVIDLPTRLTHSNQIGPVARLARNDFTLQTGFIKDRARIFTAAGTRPSHRGQFAVDHLYHFALNFEIALHIRLIGPIGPIFTLRSYRGFGV
jgi:hypothetical protein